MSRLFRLVVNLSGYSQIVFCNVCLLVVPLETYYVVSLIAVLAAADANNNSTTVSQKEEHINLNSDF